jgi:5-(carboxyamino)imidazole ribonucleotide synthase
LDSMSSFFVQARVDDAIATGELAKKSDVITFENEFVDLEALSSLAERGVCFRPRLEALAPLLDKYHQRCYLRDIGIPVPKFTALDLQQNANDLYIFSKFGFPVVLKARRHGYDGQGTYIIKDAQHLEATLEGIKKGRFKASHVEFLLEEFIPFTHELAVIAARSVSGEVVNYPVVETQQQEQVCHRAIAPVNISPQVAATIENISRILLNSLDAIGVFGIELFLTADDKVLVNEIAPRTHNSGHFSLDACQTSQFEQHLRAICGLPLGNPSLICPGAVMVNLLGYESSISDYEEKRQLIKKIPNAHLHWYGKSESRHGRKLGHVTVLLENPSRDYALEVAQQVESIWYPTQT